jgi:hypothetical protein
LPKLVEEAASVLLQLSLLAKNLFGGVLKDIRGRLESTAYGVGRGALNAAGIDKRTALKR